MNPPPGQPPVDPRGTLRPPGYPPSGAAPAGARPAAPAPFMMPPPWMMPQRSGGGVKGVLLAIVTVLLGLSVLFNFLMLIVVAVSAGPQPGHSVKQVLTAGDVKQGIAVISVYGLIYDDLEQQFLDDLQTAEDDANIKALVVDVDSPGGTVTDSHQMYEALRQFKQRSGKPVVVHMDSVAASGGYFIACAADEIVAEESTITGSIGVLISYPELSEFAEKTGIRFRTMVAEGSPRKNMLDMWSPPSDEDMEEVSALLNQQHELFRSVVEAGRSQALQSRGVSLDEVTNGQVWLGGEAQKLGLVDTVGFFEDAISAAAGRAGLTKPNVVRYTREPTLAEVLGLVQAPAAGMKLNWEAIKTDEMKRAALQLLHEVASPRTLYLYRGAR